MADVFISYSGKDEAFVRQLHEALAKHDRESWIDWKDIPPTAEWLKEIFANIEAADNFLFVISPDSCASDMCREEVAYAEANHKRLIPVVCRAVKNRDLPPALARIQWIAFTDRSFDTAFQSLIETLDTDLVWVRSHTRLLIRAREWDIKGRESAFLLRGMDLQNAIQWLAQARTKEPKASALQQEYVRVSQEWEAGEIERLKDLNEEKDRQMRVATARERLAYALSSFGEDPELSLLLSMHAAAATRPHDRSVLPEVENFLHQALLESRIRITLRGHEDSVFSVAWSPNGQRLATGSQDETAKVWEAATGRELLTLRGHGREVQGVAWSPDGNRLATVSYDRTAKVWEVATGHELLTLRGHENCVFSVAWSPDARRLATASADETARVWEAATGRELLTIRDCNSSSVAWSPDGTRLATGGGWINTNVATVWDAATGREGVRLKGHEGFIHSVAWSPDGLLLATGSADRTAKVWEVATGQELLTIRCHDESVFMVAWSPDGQRLATVDRTAKVWQVATAREMIRLKGSSTALAWSPDGSRLVTGSKDNTAKVWEVAPGLELPPLRGHESAVSSVAWSPDGSRLATGSERSFRLLRGVTRMNLCKSTCARNRWQRERVARSQSPSSPVRSIHRVTDNALFSLQAVPLSGIGK